MTRREGVSVVVCCHNSAQRLPPTMRHLAQQRTQVPWEVIVVDNASTDDTATVARSQWPFDAISLQVVSEPSLGLSYARARGIAAAKYEFIAFVDDDNWLEPDWVETAFRVMTANPDVGACGGRSRAAFDGDAPPWFAKVQMSYAVGDRGAEAKDLGDRDGWLWGAGLVLRQTAWTKLVAAGFVQQVPDRQGKALTSGGDAEICLALRRARWRLQYDPRMRFTHYIPSQRLRWNYYLAMIRGCGQMGPVLDALQPSIPHLNWRGRWLQRSWLVQAALTLWELLASDTLKAVGLRPLREGDLDAAWVETGRARLVALLRERRRYRTRFDAQQAVRWDEAGPDQR
jgi:GT2 family glycosyltransferase